jgi:hypothetical protein
MLTARAVTNENNKEAQKLMYDRARTARLAQLRKFEPPLTESKIVRERSLLEEAIRGVKGEAAGALPIEAHVNQPSNGASVNRQASCRTTTAEVKNEHEPRSQPEWPDAFEFQVRSADQWF